ncbi:MAG: AAA family ATPase [Anaerolineales bacterium]|nr:AAA family ATPase [Anaerolineales bacterium]
MVSPILATKLYVPPPRPKAVLRARLIERLNQGLAQSRKLSLVSAPAGFGKTTLVAEWAASMGPSTAWLSLDEGDNDSTRFLTYLVAAVRTVAPKFGEEVVAALSVQSPQSPPTEVVLTALLNEITTLPDPLILVLDDFHVIQAQAVDLALNFLLEHLPKQLHLVITSREDPPLPLARLRARGQLTELRAADLRFTAAEAVEFLNAVMGLTLSAGDIAALETRTEGWIAGLQMAALSMQGQTDTHAFIQAFAGDHRYIVDYLVDEVLQRQPDAIRAFLYQTAILDRLNGSLCEAVTGQPGGTARLEALERGNFFVVPLDDRRHWYRYHHLFAEVLQAHLRVEEPGLVPTLHRRASEWYAQNNLVNEAIHHALAAKDFAWAARLIEPVIPGMLRSRQEAELLGWLRTLPDEVVRHQPVLSAGYASVAMSNGEFAGVEDRLRDAERWLEPPDDPDAGAMVIVDAEGFRRLPGAIAVSRAGLALAQGNVPDTVKYAQRALELVPEDDQVRRGSAAALLGLAAWAIGDLEAAHRFYAEGRASLHKAGHLSDVLGCSIALADIRIAQGRLREAMGTYEHALQLANAPGKPVLRGTADMYVGMSMVHLEHNDLKAAEQCLHRGEALGDHLGLPQNPYRGRVAMARLKQCQGDLAGALELLQEAERRYVGDFSPNVRPVAAWTSRLWLAQGRLVDAVNWVRAHGLSVDDDLSYLREFEHFTLARVRLAQFQHHRAADALPGVLRLLERLQQAAEAGGRAGSVIESLMLQALAHAAQGDRKAALSLLERALALAEPEGYVRLFVDEGPALTPLLREAASRSSRAAFASQLLAAIEPEPLTADGEARRRTAPAAPPLTEPLSQRELDVLRLLDTELSGPEIARELIIALTTLRTHTKRIYSKLNVDSRRAAVKRASELGLI